MTVCYTDEVDDATRIMNDENVQWLKNNVAPFPEVVEKWKATTKYRTGNFIEVDETIQTYLQYFPSLRKPLGYQLFAIDFYELYPGKENLLFTKWPKLHPIILEIGATKKDRFLKEILSEHENQAGTYHL